MYHHSAAILVVGLVLYGSVDGVAAGEVRQAALGENRAEVVQEVQGGEQAVVAALELMVRELQEELGRVSSSVADAMESLERTLEAIRTALEYEAPESEEVGYGNRAYVNTNRVAACPHGSYVSGIRVEYGGTCLNQCNADGGIIRNIVLTCTELPIRPLR